MLKYCRFCKKILDQLHIYPHISMFKKGLCVDDISQELIDDPIKPHLHVYYECKDCNYKLAENDLSLMSDWELDKSLADGKLIKPEKTVRYWKQWLENNKKTKI